MKPQAQTLQERFGFKDPELTTPAHDALMMWLDKELSDTSLLEKILPLPRWDFSSPNPIYKEVEKKMETLDLPPPEYLMGSKIWESPITNQKGYIIGFADMEVRYASPYLLFETIDKFSERYQDKADGCCFFEVKPTIPSIGELIRQIRMYQTCTKGKWFVVSPDNRFAVQIIKQEIGFVQAPEGII